VRDCPKIEQNCEERGSTVDRQRSRVESGTVSAQSAEPAELTDREEEGSDEDTEDPGDDVGTV